MDPARHVLDRGVAAQDVVDDLVVQPVGDAAFDVGEVDVDVAGFVDYLRAGVIVDFYGAVFE